MEVYVMQSARIIWRRQPLVVLPICPTIIQRTTKLAKHAGNRRHQASDLGEDMFRFARPLAVSAMALTLAAPAFAQTKADAPIPLRIDAGSPGAKIDRNIFGQFAEHLGTGIYGGVWVGK